MDGRFLDIDVGIDSMYIISFLQLADIFEVSIVAHT